MRFSKPNDMNENFETDFEIPPAATAAANDFLNADKGRLEKLLNAPDLMTLQQLRREIMPEAEVAFQAAGVKTADGKRALIYELVQRWNSRNPTPTPKQSSE